MTAINTTEIAIDAAQVAALKTAMNITMEAIQLERGAGRDVMREVVIGAIESMIGGRAASQLGLAWVPGQGDAGCRPGTMLVPDGYGAELVRSAMVLVWRHAVDECADQDQAREARGVLRHIMQAI